MAIPADIAGKNKCRLDTLLFERGLAESRTRAQALIMSGQVFSETQRFDKPGMQVSLDTPITLKGQDYPWVSRGGVKLAHALEQFSLDPIDLVCMDVGASTGGFTDVLLQHGAAKVFALDVGHGQLAWKLRNDERVIVLEKTNVRHIGPKEIPEPVDLVVSDVSFISLTVALPAALKMTKPSAKLVTLIKPQFEVGKGQVGKGGVVLDAELHEEVCHRIQTWVNDLPEWSVSGLAESPITGPKGNKEFLLFAEKNSA